MNEFLAGATTIASWTIALFFLRFWKDTRDRLFAMFAVSFWLLGLIRLGLVLMGPVSESHTLLYLVRLAAYVLIVVAIVDKNRTSPRGRDS